MSYQKDRRMPFSKNAYNKLLGGAKNFVQVLDSPIGKAGIIAGTSAIGNPELAPPIIGGIELISRSGLTKKLQKMHHMH